MFGNGKNVISGKHGPLIAAIDQGTSSTRFLVFAAGTGEVLTYDQLELKQIFPQEGWVEQEPKVLLQSVLTTMENTMENLRSLEINPADIKAIGLTNQRETTVVWRKSDGEPLHNAILWCDGRTASTVDTLLKETPGHDKNFLKELCGLPVATYFSAVKLRWLFDNVPEVREAAETEDLLFGTVDSYLIWHLTGGVHGGLHVTDVTNASRTMLMNITSLKWDAALCKYFKIPMSILPEIRSSSEIYGYLTTGSLLGLPIAGVLGDQQAALLGQMCMEKGQAKNTYGTGCFLLYNTGTQIVQSQHGLLTTVGYKLGPDAATVYALEGSVAVAGAAINWLKDMGFISTATDIETLAKKVKDCGGVYFVPAFSGLYAPYWRSDARGTICGLTQHSSTPQFARAALEAICFQTREILDAMQLDSGIGLSKLLVDGGMTGNDTLMQLQADLTGVLVARPSMTETTSLGVAMAAGAAIGVWDFTKLTPITTDDFRPSILPEERELRYDRWKMAVERSLGWELPRDKQPGPGTESEVYGKHNIIAS